MEGSKDTVVISSKEYYGLRESKEKLLKERRERRSTEWKLSKDRLPKDGEDILFAVKPTANSTLLRIYHGVWDASRMVWKRDNGQHINSAVAWRSTGDLDKLRSLVFGEGQGKGNGSGSGNLEEV